MKGLENKEHYWKKVYVEICKGIEEWEDDDASGVEASIDISDGRECDYVSVELFAVCDTHYNTKEKRWELDKQIKWYIRGVGEGFAESPEITYCPFCGKKLPKDYND